MLACSKSTKQSSECGNQLRSFVIKNKFILKSHRLEYLSKYELSLRCYGDLLKSHNVCEVSFTKEL